MHINFHMEKNFLIIQTNQLFKSVCGCVFVCLVADCSNIILGKGTIEIREI